MRRTIAMLMSAVLFVGSFGLTAVRADGTNPMETGKKWLKFSEKTKSNKFSPYIKLGGNTNNAQVIVQAKSPQLNQLENEIKAISPQIKVTNSYKHTFKGLALSGPSNQLNKLASLTNIKSVYPVLRYKKLGSPTKTVGAEKVWGMKGPKGTSVTGAGVKVGVVDTGIDYNHPDLKKNYKGGYNVFKKNNDPLDGDGHGTHVSGIIAANGKMKGMAPDASLYVYKVLDNNGYGTTATVMAGIEKAI